MSYSCCSADGPSCRRRLVRAGALCLRGSHVFRRGVVRAALRIFVLGVAAL
jgi:hypothetical protein